MERLSHSSKQFNKNQRKRKNAMNFIRFEIQITLNFLLID